MVRRCVTTHFVERSRLNRRSPRRARPEQQFGGRTWSAERLPRMVGHKLGEFAATRTFKGHSAKGGTTAPAAGLSPSAGGWS
jgi:hypothetical protein